MGKRESVADSAREKYLREKNEAQIPKNVRYILPQSHTLLPGAQKDLQIRL